MPQQKELKDILGAVLRAKDHADFTTFMFAEGPYTMYGRMRIQSIERTIKDSFDVLVAVRDLAEKAGNREILELLSRASFEVLPVHA